MNDLLKKENIYIASIIKICTYDNTHIMNLQNIKPLLTDSEATAC